MNLFDDLVPLVDRYTEALKLKNELMMKQVELGKIISKNIICNHTPIQFENTEDDMVIVCEIFESEHAEQGTPIRVSVNHFISTIKYSESKVTYNQLLRLNIS